MESEVGGWRLVDWRQRNLSRALGLSVGAVSKYLRAPRACGIGAAEAETLSEVDLEHRVFGITNTPARGRAIGRSSRQFPTCVD
jgi:hypothetical protein